MESHMREPVYGDIEVLKIQALIREKELTTQARAMKQRGVELLHEGP